MISRIGHARSYAAPGYFGSKSRFFSKGVATLTNHDLARLPTHSIVVPEAFRDRIFGCREPVL